MKKELKEKIQLSIAKKIKEELVIDLTKEETFSLELIDTSYIAQEKYSCIFMGMTIDVYILFDQIQDIMLYRLAS